MWPAGRFGPIHKSMKKPVVIVDSICKRNVLTKFLGNNYQVLSVLGPVSQLPRREFAVDIERDFKATQTMSYVQKDVLRRLVEAAGQSNRIYIATEPNLPGETIAYDLAEKMAIANGNIKRLRLREITESALLKAIKKPLRINSDFVQAHQARCVFDHLIDAKIGPIISHALGKSVRIGYTAGLALRLLFERESEIAEFVPREYWSLGIRLQRGNSTPFFACLVKLKGERPEIPNKYHAKALISDLKEQSLKIQHVEKKQILHPAAPAFTTSTLQQEAARRFGFSGTRTMIIAKQLYEGVELGSGASAGMISYFNTDAGKIAEQASLKAREMILMDYGKEYLLQNGLPKNEKKGSSKWDEAIRPTEVRRTPKKVKRYLTVDQLKLYSLIWNRFIASQMANPESEQTIVDCIAGSDQRYLFRAIGTEVRFRGYLQVYESATREDQELEKTKLPTELRPNEPLKLIECIPRKNVTRAPSSFSEGDLLAELEQHGLGLLSMQGSAISSLLSGGLLERLQQNLVPTQTGRIVGNLLIEFFPEIFNLGFAARLEEELSQIENGFKKYRIALSNFYKPLNRAVENAKAQQSGRPPGSVASAQEICPLCGANLISKWGRHGKFYACAMHPSRCSFTKAAELAADRVFEKCRECGREMVVRMGKNGKFLGCSGYPACNHSESVPLDAKCPAEGCQGNVVERQTAKGRRFYGCSLYPRCDFSSWQMPANIVCPACGNLYLVTHATPAMGDFYRCPHCKKKFDLDLLPLKEQRSQPSLA